MAAGDGERVGENLGDLLGGWAKSLYVGIAGGGGAGVPAQPQFADLAVFMVAAVLVGGFVMAPERHRRRGARHLADDHGLMAERWSIRSYRRVFEVDRRIYRVDRWALPVPGGVPLRGGRLLRRGAAGGDRGRRAARASASWSARVSAPLRFVVVPLAVAVLGTQAAPDGRVGASLRVGLAAAAAAGAAALGGPAWCRSRASRCAWHGELALRWDGDARAACTAARVRGPARVTFNVPVRLRARPAAGWSRAAGATAGEVPQAVVLCAGVVLEVRP